MGTWARVLSSIPSPVTAAQESRAKRKQSNQVTYFELSVSSGVKIPLGWSLLLKVGDFCLVSVVNAPAFSCIVVFRSRSLQLPELGKSHVYCGNEFGNIFNLSLLSDLSHTSSSVGSNSRRRHFWGDENVFIFQRKTQQRTCPVFARTTASCTQNIPLQQWKVSQSL